ncbi:MAG: flagellar assembly protein FliH, partial [Caulobacteraceae bacterium]
MTTGLPKFSFDTVFEEDGRVIAPVRVKKNFTAEEVEAIRAECFAEGERSVVALAQQAQAVALGDLADVARMALSALAEVAHQHRAGSARLALAAARKIAGAALDRFPEAPLQAAVDSLAREVEAVPRLVLRCAPESLEVMQTALGHAAEAAGYPGQILAKADSALKPAAFVLDWGDGSAAFDPEQAAARVAQALETGLAADGLHAEPLTHPDEAP